MNRDRLLLGDEESSFKIHLNKWISQTISPRAFEIEKGGSFPQEILFEVLEKGYNRFLYPKYLGGWGKNYLTFSVMMREFAAAEPNISVYLAVQNSIIAGSLKKYIFDPLPIGSDYLLEDFRTEKLKNLKEKTHFPENSELISPDLKEKISRQFDELVQKNPKFKKMGNLPLLDKVSLLAQMDPRLERDPDCGSLVTLSSIHQEIALLTQYQNFLVPFVKGKALGTFALTEPDAGSDATAGKTFAHLESVGQTLCQSHFKVNGSKTWISFGCDKELMKGNLFHLLISQTPFGPSAFWVHSDNSGISVTPIKDKLFLNATGTATLSFNDTPVSGINLIGKIGEGFRVAFGALDQGRLGIAAQAYGYGYGAFQSAYLYAGLRVQLGKPIKEHPSLSKRLVEMKLDVDASCLLIRYACSQQDSGQEFGSLGSLAKLFSSERAMQICEGAIQVKGGYGYSFEDPVGRLFAASKITQIYEGTSQIQAMLISQGIFQEWNKSENLEISYKQIFEKTLASEAPQKKRQLQNQWDLLKEILTRLIQMDSQELGLNFEPKEGPTQMKGGFRFHQKFFEVDLAMAFARFIVGILSLSRILEGKEKNYSKDQLLPLILSSELHLFEGERALLNLAQAIGGIQSKMPLNTPPLITGWAFLHQFPLPE